MRDIDYKHATLRALLHGCHTCVQSGIDGSELPTLLDGEAALPRQPRATVLFKSCGNALWDLAAARALLEAPFEAPSATAG